MVSLIPGTSQTRLSDDGQAHQIPKHCHGHPVLQKASQCQTLLSLA